MRFLFFIGILFFALLSCKTGKKIQSKDAINPNISVKSAVTDSIVFIQFIIKSDTVNNISRIELMQKQSQAGVLKQKMNRSASTNNFLEIILTDKITNQIDTLLMEHPLYKTVEFVDEKGALGKKDVFLDQSEFFIRFSKKNTTFIQIIETTPFVKNHIIFNIVL